MRRIEFNTRQKRIIEIVKSKQPITSTEIAEILGVTRAALRADLGILTLAGNLIAKPKVGYCYNDAITASGYGDVIRDLLVGDVKSIPVVVDEKSSVYDAVVALFLEDASTVFVHSEGFLAGLVSRKDFLKAALGGHDFQKIPVAVIMTRMPNIIMASPQESVIEAAEKIVAHQVDCLPVVESHEKKGKPVYKVVGSISKTNISRIFVELSK